MGSIAACSLRGAALTLKLFTSAVIRGDRCADMLDWTCLTGLQCAVAQPGGEATMCLTEILDMPRVAAGEELLPLWPDQNQIFTLLPLTTELGDPRALEVTVVGRRASRAPVWHCQGIQCPLEWIDRITTPC